MSLPMQQHLGHDLCCAGQPPNVSYSSAYSVDRRKVSWEAYDSKLRGYGILVKARNSLVFQVLCWWLVPA